MSLANILLTHKQLTDTSFREYKVIRFRYQRNVPTLTQHTLGGVSEETINGISAADSEGSLFEIASKKPPFSSIICWQDSHTDFHIIIIISWNINPFTINS